MAITTRYGCEVELISAIRHEYEITGAVARRVEDGATRCYLLSDLRAPNGAYEVYNAVIEADKVAVAKSASESTIYGGRVSMDEVETVNVVRIGGAK